MSLALLVDVDGGKSGESRLTLMVGGFMTAALLLAALQQFHEDGADARWWLPLGCALACACACFVSWRRSCRRPGLRLQAMPDGRWRLSEPDGRLGVDAVCVGGWRLGGLIWLHLRHASKVDPAAASADRAESIPISGTADCRLLMARRCFDEREWHAMLRWLVWQQRSRRRSTGRD